MSQAGIIRTGGAGDDEGGDTGAGDGARGQARQDPAFNKLSLTAKEACALSKGMTHGNQS